MRRSTVALMMALVSGVAILAAADRMTDKDLKTLVERVDEERDRFEDALDGKLKSSIVRGPAGEADVGKFLDDFQNNVDRLKERMNADYAGSAEVSTILQQATIIDNFFRQQPAGTKGDSEWTRLAGSLKTLATTYGTSFPTAPGATVRRMSRKEFTGLASEIADNADQFKKALDDDLKKDTAVTQAQRETIVKEADALKKDAEELRSAVNDDRPSAGESERLLSRGSKLQAFMDARKVPTPTAQGAWGQMSPRLQRLAGEYGTTWR